jgi:fumarate hydratase class II
LLTNRFAIVTAENKFEALAAHDAIVEAHGAVKTVAASLMKIGNDIRMLSSGPRSGYCRNHIPDNETRFVNYARKSKPYSMQRAVTIVAQVMGNDVAINIGGSMVILS